MKKIKKIKFNLLDVVIIIILISLVIAAYLQTNHREITMMNIKESSASITLKVETCNDDTGDFSKLVGSSLYLAENNQKTGVVAGVSECNDDFITNQTVIREVGIDCNNKSYLITLDDVNVKNNTERGYYLNGSYFIAKGKSLDLTTDNGFSFSAVIDDITPDA